MPVGFDPYHKWLGIPPEEQPPNLYRLLGVRLFESDPDVISNAADQRMGLLKTFAAGNNGSLAEDLLNEVARARVCLLNPGKKQTYDGSLRDWVSPASSQTPIQDGFWLPPMDGKSDTLEVTCLNCEESVVYDLKLTAQVTLCKRCNKPMRLPGHDEVTQAAASLAQRSVPSAASSSNESLNSQNARGARQEPSRVQTSKLQSFSVSETGLDLPLGLQHSASAIVRHRRNKPRRSLLAFIFTILLGAVVGLPAGYFVLCVIDLRYDFLHLIAVEESNDAESTDIPPNVPREMRQRPATPPLARLRRKAQVPPVNAPFIGRPPVDQPDDNSNPQRIPPLVDPFANILPQLPLPRPQALNKPTGLITVPLEQLDNFELAIVGVGAGHDSQLSLRRPQNEPVWTWEVMWISANIGTFSIVNNELRFVWASNPNDLGVVALRNSILRIRANQQDHFVPLRLPLLMVPHTLDLNNAVERVICECDDLPAPTELRVDILHLENWPPYQIEGAGLLGLKINEETIIRYPEASSVTTKVKFVIVKNLPTIALETRYRLPSGEEDTMNIRRGNRRLTNLRKSSMLRSNPSLRSDLQALQHVAEIAAKLHEKAKMEYRLYSVVDQHEIELATTRP